MRLTGARIGLQLDCSGATITNSSGAALNCTNLQVGGDVYLRAGFAADGAGELGTVRLVGANIGGQLDCSGAVAKSRSDPQHRWALDGSTYSRLPLDPLPRYRAELQHLGTAATDRRPRRPVYRRLHRHRPQNIEANYAIGLPAFRQAQRSSHAA